MTNLIDTYNKNPKICENLLSSYNVKINLKAIGKSFQILNENDTLRYFSISNDDTLVGEELTEYSRLFSKSLNTAINIVESNQDAYKKYKFIDCAVINDKLYLSSIVDNENKFIESSIDLNPIANELGIEVIPIIFEGVLNNEQVESIKKILEAGVIPEGEEFINWLKETFGEYEFFCEDFINEYPTLVEGASFIFTVSDKLVDWNISIKKDTNVNENLNEKNKETLDKIYNIFNEFKENVNWNQSENVLENLQINFERMMAIPKTYNKLMNLGSKLNINESEETSIQKDMLNKSLRKNIQMKGTVYKTLFESFVKVFYNERES